MFVQRPEQNLLAIIQSEPFPLDESIHDLEQAGRSTEFADEFILAHFLVKSFQQLKSSTQAELALAFEEH